MNIKGVKILLTFVKINQGQFFILMCANILEQAHRNSTSILLYIHITTCSVRISLIEESF